MIAARSIFFNLWRLIKYMWHEDKKLLVSYFATSVLGALLLYLVFFAYKVMIDRISGHTAFAPFIGLEIIVITYLFFEYLSRFVNYTFNNYYFDYVIRAKFQNLLTRLFLKKLADLSFAELENGEVRNLIAKIEASYLQRLPELLTKTNAIIYNLSALGFSLIIAFQFNPLYFLILAVVSVPIYFLRAKYGNVAFNNYASNAPKTNYLNYLRYLFTNFTTLNEIKLYNLSDHLIKKTKKIQDEVLEDYSKPIRRYSLLSTVSFVLIPVAIYFSITRFISRISLGLFSLGDFTLFLNALFTFSGQISSILVNVGSIYENNLYAEDFFKLQDKKTSLLISTIPNSSPALPSQITFDNVSFTYPGRHHPSLINVNLTINTGHNIALVGNNGAGKSTLVKLLLRFYSPTHGKIMVDGRDLATIPLPQWYRSIGILFQDYARYFFSLKENIHFGDISNHNEERLKEAFFAAQGEDVLNNLPLGFDQILGRWFEGGVELSGGQWQKVAIARAIYRDAPILILDEPTSAIDAETETHIFNHLNQLYLNKTLLFISHRFSTVRTADTIFVMNQGQLVERGNHAFLMEQQGLYAHYFSLQQRGYQ
jgi:ATP-binding cassette, subfamily B, bacterial